MLFCSAPITRSGRQGVAASNLQTRASENLQESVKFSRAIYNSLGMSSAFNAISACSPEISILAYAHSGPTPGLLSLRMEDPKRKEIENEISFGLGAGSRASALISKGQRDTSTSEIAVGYAAQAAALTDQDDEDFKEDCS